MIERSVTTRFVGVDLKHEITAAFWGAPPELERPRVQSHSGSSSAAEYCPCDLYFNYCIKQCELLVSHGRDEWCSVKEYEDIFQIAKAIRDGVAREEISQSLPASGLAGTTAQHNRSLDLVARLLVMMEFGDIPHGYSPWTKLQWQKGSLRDFVSQHFSVAEALPPSNVKLERSFNATNLENIGGIKIRWTSSLADHLRLMEDDKGDWVAVFQHPSWLEYQKRYAWI
jgi:hypothetical protein